MKAVEGAALSFRVRSLTVVPVLVAALLALSAFRPAHGVSGMETGSWWLAHAGGAPAPAHVPDGGLWVSNGASGPTAVSALRFTLADHESLPVVQLRTASNPTPELVSITACATQSEWQPVTAGAWDDRPEPDCEAGQVLATMSSDGATLQLDLSGFVLSERTVDIVMFATPGSGPGGSAPLPVEVPTPETPYDITFERPEAGDIFVHREVIPPSTAPPAEEPPESGGATASAPGAAPAPAIIEPGPPATAPPTADITSAAIPEESATGLVPAVSVPDDRAERLLAAAVLLVLAGAWWRVASRRPTGQPGMRVDGLGGDAFTVASPLGARFGTPAGDVPALR